MVARHATVALELRLAGATVVDVHVPEWLIEAREEWYTTIRWREFRAQIPDYLATLGREYPKTLAELVARSRTIMSTTGDRSGPNPARWDLFVREEASGRLEDAEYVALCAEFPSLSWLEAEPEAALSGIRSLVHRLLAIQAAESGVSLNCLISRKLS